jgi:hypothetical protein
MGAEPESGICRVGEGNLRQDARNFPDEWVKAHINLLGSGSLSRFGSPRDTLAAAVGTRIAIISDGF